jgi:hypothetical protein
MRHSNHAAAYLFELELLARGGRSNQFTYLTRQP